MKKMLAEHSGKAAICFGVIAAVIYLAMINITLGHIAAVSGQVPFDMRPMGYSPADADALLAGLGIDGRRYYLNYQIPFDMVYPAMLALTLICTIHWFGHGMMHRKLARFAIMFSLVGALFDYVENIGIVAMIWMWSEVPALLVLFVSSATILKSVFTTLAVFTTVFVGYEWMRDRKINLSTREV